LVDEFKDNHMAIDSSIPLGVKPIQIANPFDLYAQAQQVQGLQNQNRLADLMYGEKQRDLAADRVQADALANSQDVAAALAKAGYGTRSLAYTKGQQDIAKQRADIAKTQAETQKQQIEAAGKRIDLFGQAMNYVRQNPTLDNAFAALDHLGNNGVFTPEQVAQHKAEVQADPTKIQVLAEQAFRASLSAKDQLAKIDTRNVGGTTDTAAIDPVTGAVRIVSSVRNTVSPDAALQANTARRGQDLADQRARELNANSRGQYDAARGVLVDTRTGTATAVTGPDGKPLTRDKAMTEFQGKSAGFADRAQEADVILQQLEGKYSPAAINAKQSVQDFPLVGGALGAATNKLALSESDQRAEQAQRNFVNSILRQESGAAISAGEFENAKRQYFPQPGDSAAVIAQKAANRRTAIAGLARSAGGNYTPPATATPDASPSNNGLPTGWTVEVH
jgi:hypothetical protein